MQATESNFLQFLKAPKQFGIPIYQRPYSWTLKQCQQLWSDIVRVARDDAVTGHFIGSIVYIEKGIYQVASVPQLLVIDGQQRLTVSFRWACKNRPPHAGRRSRPVSVRVANDRLCLGWIRLAGEAIRGPSALGEDSLFTERAGVPS